MTDVRNIIVIGASAGGIPAVKTIISGLSHQMEIVVIVVIHVSRKSNSARIANAFQKETTLICKEASNQMLLERGNLYVAPPEYQLMLKDHFLHLNPGPHENKYRPSIDVLFRSAAVKYGHRAIGIVLTGLFDDGTSGMSAIKRSGGICIVQNPAEAEHPDMPQSVLNKIAVDYKANLQEIPLIITEILKKPLPPEKPVPRELQIEAEITEKMMSNIDQMKEIGNHSDFVCPDCGGG
ncbi:chemotaxis protein CheB [Autumnicola edwardsiae]|uniref:protein-glutamate methylesterase n=1 Tax=Autumnicola edwardsiae TaxID=3075594 RepID=A0ABU3CZL9_9FLAO|nr:chemotaxis protein CheB [Zunongwangia sp. F297]MDT0651815.1 chemotaxis protein CheB [Zunongwangia sp. F297]